MDNLSCPFELKSEYCQTSAGAALEISEFLYFLPPNLQLTFFGQAGGTNYLFYAFFDGLKGIAQIVLKLYFSNPSPP